ncbi:MAG: peptidoglycan glycosyltransferase, partial [Defluviitaleaceae bacterium]|nr:peptidoglycan glycosyltransferase [Defluviitaleaceae bacterium]
MQKPTIKMRRKMLFIMAAFELILVCLIGRILYIQAVEGPDLQARAYEQQTRDRLLTPVRGSIYDRNMTGLAVTETVYSVSVIHNQVKNAEEVAKALSDSLQMDYNSVLADVSKKVALERIEDKVDTATADAIRNMNLPGVVVDEDVQRVYPYSTLASQVIGFVGSDNQGIIGLEAKYDKYLEGASGKILTETDVVGRELANGLQTRIQPTQGDSLVTSLDVILQQYAEQTIEKAVQVKNAKDGLIILMNPQNGEIYALANYPDFDLNDPFTINDPSLAAIWDTLTPQEQMNDLNEMWRDTAIS